jgi:hypothetical protein
LFFGPTVEFLLLWRSCFFSRKLVKIFKVNFRNGKGRAVSILYDRLYNDADAGEHGPVGQRGRLESADLPSRQHRELLLRYHQARLRPPRAASLVSRIKALFEY